MRFFSFFFPFLFFSFQISSFWQPQKLSETEADHVNRDRVENCNIKQVSKTSLFNSVLLDCAVRCTAWASGLHASRPLFPCALWSGRSWGGGLRSSSLDFSPGLMVGATQQASFWPLPWQPGNFQTLPACLHHPLNPASTPFHSSGQKCSPALREPGNPPNFPTPLHPSSSLPSPPPKPAFFWKDSSESPHSFPHFPFIQD